MGSYDPGTLSDINEIIGDGQIIVLEPEKWIGKRFPLLHYIDVGEEIAEGQWLVLLYQHGCPECQEATENLGQIARQMEASQFALVEIPPHSSSQKAVDAEGIRVLHGHLSNAQVWFVHTPVFLNVENGQVLRQTDRSSGKRN